jgi:hypothetical protein
VIVGKAAGEEKKEGQVRKPAKSIINNVSGKEVKNDF